jgi:hypothetical protein
MGIEQSEFACPALLLGLVVKVPRVSNHEFEVFIIVNRATYVVVVLNKLIQLNCSVSRSRVLQD